MSLLTLILIALLLAAWKAPGWVKEFGLIALAMSFVYPMANFIRAAGVVMKAGDISPLLVWGGIRTSLVPIVYGIIIYLVSLIIRIIQKPRLL